MISEWISDKAKEEISAQKVRDEDRLLALIAEDPKSAQASLATKMGWKLYSGEPHKTKAKRRRLPKAGQAHQGNPQRQLQADRGRREAWTWPHEKPDKILGSANARRKSTKCRSSETKIATGFGTRQFLVR